MTNNELEDKIQELTKQIKLQNSYKRNFSVVVVRGLGSAIGATFVFGLVLAGLFQVIKSVDYVPVLNNILNSQAIEELIRRFTQQG